MEFLIELLFELLLEGSIEISSNKKIPKWIRYPLILIIILFFAIVIIGIFIVGILLYKENIFASIFMIAISLIFFIASIVKFRNIYYIKTR